MQEALKLPNAAGTSHAGESVPVFSDPSQTTLSVRLSTLCIVEAVVIALLVGVIGVMAYRGPIAVTVRQTPNGDEVIAYNGKPVQNPAGTVKVAADAITPGNVKLIAKKFVALLYGSPDAAQRALNVKEALLMMTDENAGKLMQCIQTRGCPEYNLDLNRKRAEGWQEQWDLGDKAEVTVDPRDPFTVNIIGFQKVTMTIAGQVSVVTKQLSLSVKLANDTEGRTERNLNNGVRVVSYQYKELGTAAQ